MEIIIYVIIFIIGAFIGSFASHATYRIPIKEDILIKHSYCPVCKEKLVLKDLVPIFSYIFLRGKCSHCGEKIKARYLILEVVSVIVFLIFLLSFNIDFANINLYDLIFMLLITTYFTTLIIIAGIDKETKKIEHTVILFNIVIAALYIIYMFYVKINIISSSIILGATILFYIINLCIIKNEKDKYIINFIIIMLLSKIWANPYIILVALALTFITLILHKCLVKTKPPIAFYYITYFASIFIGCNFII